MQGKYLIVQGQCGVHPVLFSAGLGHDEIIERDQIISAGFFDLWADNADSFRIGCFGESKSLNIKSRGVVDAKIIRFFMRGEDENFIIMGEES